MVFSFLIFFFSEDIKDKELFKKFVKITFLVGWIGVLMEVLNWNYLCKFQCSLLTFTPFIILLMIKGITLFYKGVFNKEPFHLYRKDPLDGIWIKNKWDSKNLYYHTWYSISILFFPMMTIAITYGRIKANFC